MQKSSKLIVAEYFNAHLPSWDSPNVCQRGEIFLEVTESIELIPRNQGSSPTFVRDETESQIDITFRTMDICGDIISWKVLNDYVYSDHRYFLSKISQ